MNIHDYLARQTLLSEQVSKREVEVILGELQRTLDAQVPGDVVEFGCFEGTTSVHLARFLMPTNKQLFLYDSFEGLPDKTMLDESPAGQQFKTGELLASKKQLITNLKRTGAPMPRIKKAWFSDLTPNDVPTAISFAFLDGDYYESVRQPLLLIEDRLSPGAIIVIDDYANEALPGAAKAVDEWCAARGLACMVTASLAIIRC